MKSLRNCHSNFKSPLDQASQSLLFHFYTLQAFFKENTFPEKEATEPTSCFLSGKASLCLLAHNSTIIGAGSGALQLCTPTPTLNDKRHGWLFFLISHTSNMQIVLILFFTFTSIYCWQKLLAYRSAIRSVQYVKKTNLLKHW